MAHEDDPTHTPTQLAETYFDAWQLRDVERLRAILADDVTFRGPLGAADGVEACVAGLMGMAQMITEIDVLHRWDDGTDVITWFELHTAGTDPTPTVNWSHAELGKINRIRVTFDPRGILSGST